MAEQGTKREREGTEMNKKPHSDGTEYATNDTKRRVRPRVSRLQGDSLRGKSCVTQIRKTRYGARPYPSPRGRGSVVVSKGMTLEGWHMLNCSGIATEDAGNTAGGFVDRRCIWRGRVG